MFQRFKKQKAVVNNFENMDTEYLTNDSDVINEESRVSKYFSGLEGNDDCVVAAYVSGDRRLFQCSFRFWFRESEDIINYFLYILF